LSTHEATVRGYAIEAVDASLQSMEQIVSQKRNPQFRLSRTGMCVMKPGAALKRVVMRGIVAR
jgi:hypothetical protein